MHEMQHPRLRHANPIRCRKILNVANVLQTPARRLGKVDGVQCRARLLQLLGHDTRVAYDGEAAFTVAQEYRPDVVLLDIGLPKADGYMVAQRIRGEARGQLAMLVATTGWGQSSDKEKAQ